MGTNYQTTPNQKESKPLKKPSRKRRWQQAAKDPALLKDISDIEADFLVADAETAKSLDD